MVIRWVGLFVGVLVVGWADYWTGYDVNVSVFYTAPVILAVWSSGRGAGTAMAAFAACTRMAATLATGHHFSHQGILVWNTIVFFALLELIVFGADAMRLQLQAARQKIGILEHALHPCGRCHDVEDSEGHWVPLDEFLRANEMMAKTNKLCPDCARKLSSDARSPREK